MAAAQPQYLAAVLEDPATLYRRHGVTSLE
jgi:hypothetical protein